MELNQFAEEFRQEILSQCDDEESAHFREDKFTEVMIEYLAQANEVDDGEVCYRKNKASYKREVLEDQTTTFQCRARPAEHEGT